MCTPCWEGRPQFHCTIQTNYLPVPVGKEPPVLPGNQALLGFSSSIATLIWCGFSGSWQPGLSHRRKVVPWTCSSWPGTTAITLPSHSSIGSQGRDAGPQSILVQLPGMLGWMPQIGFLWWHRGQEAGIFSVQCNFESDGVDFLKLFKYFAFWVVGRKKTAQS